MNEAFVTVADLSDYTGTDAETGQGYFACAAASEIVRGYVDNEMTLEVGVVDRLDGTGTDQLLLRHPPIRSVTSVVENDAILTEDTDYFLGVAGILYRVGSTWLSGRGNVIVTYDRGYDLVVGSGSGDTLLLPTDVRQVTLALAKRLLASGTLPAGGFTQEQIGAYAYTRPESATGGLDLDRSERTVLDHYISRRVT